MPFCIVCAPSQSGTSCERANAIAAIRATTRVLEEVQFEERQQLGNDNDMDAQRAGLAKIGL